MTKIYTSLTQLVGNTPLVALTNIQKQHNLKATLLGKLEYFNPAGSVKDRVALHMILDAEEKGILRAGSVIIEPTSGNTGIGLCSIAATRGYRVIIVMPDTMSMERRLLMKAYGAELVLTDGKLGMAGAIAKANELANKIENSFIPAQFENPANPMAHYKTTGPEILRDTDGKIDIFVCGVGTGGSITGIGKFLKEHCPAIKIVAVEPDDSAVLSGDKSGPHAIQGIGAGFVPKILDIGIYDEIFRVTSSEAYTAGTEMARSEGFLVGVSAGAALHAAIALAKRPENENKNIVVLLPDTGERYLSTPMFS